MPDAEGRPTIFDRLGEVPQVAAMVGWRLVSIDSSTSTVIVGFDADQKFANPIGGLHGGLIATMFDEAMGSTIIGLSDATQFGSTISMTVNYGAPVRLAQTVSIESSVTSKGSRIWQLEGTLRQADGAAAATALASYSVRSFPAR